MKWLYIVIRCHIKGYRSGASRPCKVFEDIWDARDFIRDKINNNTVFSKYEWKETDKDTWECENFAFLIREILYVPKTEESG